MLRLQKEYGIEHSGSTIGHRSHKLDEAEAILHELAHGMCLGDPRRSAVASIDYHLPAAYAARNEHELTTLRVELTALEKLGHGFSTRKQNALLESAIFARDLIPPREALHAPLSIAEQALAVMTTNLILRAHRELKQRAWQP
jgi:hypothetical protein